MPYCEVDRYQSGDKWEGVRLFYRRYGRGATKVLLVVGLAGTHDSWGLQIKGLTGSVEPTDEDEAAQRTDEGAGDTAAAEDDDGEGGGIEVCSFDNRGVGRSSILPHKSHYSTAIMARDALALMDHLGWKKAHVFGHSMGAMISCKLAAIAPHRLCSLGLLNVTGGGLECLPKVDGQMLSLAFRFLRAKTPEERAHVDLETHYTKVNNALMDLIKATKYAMKPHEWSSQPEITSETGALISARPVTLTKRTDEGANAAVAVYNFLAKFQLSFLYLIGLIVMGFEHVRNIVRVMKPVRVAAIES